MDSNNFVSAEGDGYRVYRNGRDLGWYADLNMAQGVYNRGTPGGDAGGAGGGGGGDGGGGGSRDPYIVRSYSEQRADGSVWEVDQYSDGSYRDRQVQAGGGAGGGAAGGGAPPGGGGTPGQGFSLTELQFNQFLASLDQQKLTTVLAQLSTLMQQTGYVISLQDLMKHFKDGTPLPQGQRTQDWEKQQELKRQYEAAQAEQKRQYDLSQAEQQRQYNLRLGEEQRQFGSQLASAPSTFVQRLLYGAGPDAAAGAAQAPQGYSALTGGLPTQGMTPEQASQFIQNTPLYQGLVRTAGGQTTQVPGGSLPFVQGRQLDPRQYLQDVRSNNPRLGLIGSLAKFAGWDPAEYFGETQQFLPQGQRAPLTRYA